MKKVAIIGAGVAGLTCLKSLLELGLEATVYECSGHLGGLWNYSPDVEDGGGPAYESLITNTSKQMMAFSDFPFPPGVKDFPSRKDVLDYIHSYVKEFNLKPYIEFGSTVVEVKKTRDQSFEISYRKNEKDITREFDWVVVANGRHEQTNIPTLDGAENFSGQIIHSRQYTKPQMFAGKKVIVVGAASSALDIVSEISDFCTETLLSIRSKSWLVPRYIEGKPYDLHLTKLSAALPKVLRELAFKMKLLNAYKKYDSNSIYKYFGTDKKELNLDRDRFVQNDLLLEKLNNANIKIIPEISSLKGNGVELVNGKTLSAEIIVFATGYRTSIHFLDYSLTGQNDDNIPLYKHVFSPKTLNLAMCGMCYIVGPILPALEMQGRYIAAVISGNKHLPTQEKMQELVDERINKCRKKGVSPMRVQTLNYLDDLAKDLKIKPNPLKNFRLMKKLLAGPIISARYRLNGLAAKPELAEKAFRNL